MVEGGRQTGNWSATDVDEGSISDKAALRELIGTRPAEP